MHKPTIILSMACALIAQQAAANSEEQDAIQLLEGGSSIVINFQGDSQNTANGLGYYGQSLLSNTDSGFVLGYRNKRGAITMLSGQGEGSEFSGAATFGLEQHYFHGGSAQAYSYQGFDGAYHMGGARWLSVGHVSVNARTLAQRTADYLKVSDSNWSLAYTKIKRTGAVAGRNLDLSLRFGDVLLSAQHLSVNAGGEFQALNVSWSGSSNDQFTFSLSTKHNELIEDDRSSRVMLSYQRQLGRVLYQDEAEAKEKKQPISSGLLVGAGAVALIGITSSGSDSQDNAPRFEQQHNAARGVLNDINPTSVRQNREYGGYVYRAPDGRYIATTPIRGQVSSVSLPFSLVPIGGAIAASYHTHAGPDPRFDNENFSFADIEGDQNAVIDGYLGTPAGQFFWHDQRGNRIVKLGAIAN
ncbi:MAG: hypothetical protein ACI9PZ_001757 [Parvicella sp.]|jgi:hypothetical protein